MENVEEEIEQPIEGLVEEPVRNISCNSVPISTIARFKMFARVYANNNYGEAIRLLLDRSMVLDMVSEFDLRLRALENRMKEDDKIRGSQIVGPDVPKTRIPKTFGGKKNE